MNKGIIDTLNKLGFEKRKKLEGKDIDVIKDMFE